MIVFQDLTVEECKQKLIEAEQLDVESFKETAMAGLERWKGDYEYFLAWGAFLIARAGQAVEQNDDERLKYYALILNPIFDYARENLVYVNYRDFQVKLIAELDRVMERAPQKE